MPLPYSLDLHWRIVWAYFTQSGISVLFNVLEQTVRQFIALFNHTGDVQWKPQSNGPKEVMGDFKQLTLLHLILVYPGIYLNEFQEKL